MNIQVVEATRQILVNGVPIEALIGASAFLVALVSLFIALKSARESARANILSYLPVITLNYDYDMSKVIIKNIGRGTAVDIVLDKYYNWSADKDFKMYGLSTVVFEKVNMLDAGKSLTVGHKVKGLEDSLGILTFTIFSKHTKNIDFIVKFRDISGKKYFTVIHIQGGKVEVREFPKSVGARTTLTLCRYRTVQGVLTVIYFIFVNYRKFKDENRTKNKK